MTIENLLDDLHHQVNEHLGSLHTLHHKQHILNTQLVISQVIEKFDTTCQHDHQDLHDLLDVITDNINTSNLGAILRVFGQFVSTETADTSCKVKIDDVKSHIRTYLNLINRETTNFKQHIQFTDLSSVDIIKAYDTIIDPLSNQKRLDIMIAIHNNNTRFKDLEQELNLQAGHLIYHLNPLKEHKYVDQDNQKNYFLTDKGSTVLEMIKYIYESYPNS